MNIATSSDIGKAIAHLININGIATLPENAVYPIQAPQNAPFPFIVYNTLSIIPTNTKGKINVDPYVLDSMSSMDKVRIQITTLATNYSQVISISTAVRNKLDNLYNFSLADAGLDSTATIQSCQFQNEYHDVNTLGSLDGVYLVHQDFYFYIAYNY
jgi:hypothetical protein